MRSRRAWACIHAGTLVVALGVLAFACRGKWFFGDEWDFILYRGLHHARWGLLYPHNEHWSTFPILWYRAVFAAFGLRTYWPYLCGVFALHLLACHLLWRLMRRAGVASAIATGLALVFAFLGAGAENMTWAFQVGFVGSLVAGLLLLLALDGAPTPWRVALVSAGAVASLPLSGISVVMVVAVAIAALARWGWRAAAKVAVPAAVVYLLWLRTAGDVGLTGDTASLHGGPSDIPRYVWDGLSAALGAPFRSDAVGSAVLLLLVAVVASRGRDWWRRGPEVCALAITAPVMFAVISQGRGSIGVAGASRYVYLADALLLPLVGFAVQQLAGTSAPRVLPVLALSVVLAVAGAFELRDITRADRTRDLTMRGQMLASLDIAAAEPTVSKFVDFTFNHDITVANLQSLRAHGELPVFTPSALNLAQARLALEVAVRHARSPKVDGACRTVDLRGKNASITRTGARAEVSVVPARDGSLVLYIPINGTFAGPRIVALTKGAPITIRSSLDGPLIVQLPPGDNEVCGAAFAAP